MPIAVYVLGRVLYDKRVGLFAAALVAASTYLIDYSSEARGYSLIALLSILITLVLLGLLRRSRPFLWSAYAVLTAIGFFTIPTFLLAFVGAVAWFGLVVFLRKQVRIYLVPFAAWTAIAGIMTVWFYTPILIFSGLDSLIANDYVRPGNLTDTLAELPAFLARMLSLVTQEAPGFFGVLIGLGALVGCVISVGRKRSISLVSIVMFGCALVLLLVERRIPFERVWTYLFAYYYLVASAGLWWLLEQVIIRVGEAHRNLLQGVFAILLAGTLLIASFNRLNRPEPPDSFPEAENIATYLAREWHPGDLVFSRFPTRAVTQYYLRQIGRSDITFAAQGREDIDSGNRFLLLIDQNSSPVEANVKQKYNNGDLVVPRLIYEYHNARVYEIIAPHPTVQ
jgi:MFS family permease